MDKELLKGLTEEDVIDGMEEKSMEEIIREVAEEEGMSEEEVAEAIEKLSQFNVSLEKKKRNKPKRDKSKEKQKKKQVKQSRKRNR